MDDAVDASEQVSMFKKIEMFALFLVLAFAVLIVIAWVMMLSLATRAHKAASVGTSLQKTCEDVYIERDSARAQVFRYWTEKSLSGKPRIMAFNDIMGMLLSVFVGSVVVAAVVAFGAATPYFEHNTSETMRKVKKVTYVALAACLVAWLLMGSASTAQEGGTAQTQDGSARLYITLKYDDENATASTRITENQMTSMDAYKWTAIVVFAAFAIMYKLTCGYSQLWYLGALCAASLALAVSTAYATPRIYNSAIVDYKRVRDDFARVYNQTSDDVPFSDTDLNSVCREYRKNKLLIEGKQVQPSECIAKGASAWEYMEHQKGSEFGDDNTPGLKALRTLMMEARNQKEGVQMTRDWSTAVIWLSILIVCIGIAPFYARFARADRLWTGYSATQWLFAGLFALIVLVVVYVWGANALESAQ